MAYPEGMILCMSKYDSLEFHALLCFLGNHSTVVVENQALCLYLTQLEDWPGGP